MRKIIPIILMLVIFFSGISMWFVMLAQMPNSPIQIYYNSSKSKLLKRDYVGLHQIRRIIRHRRVFMIAVEDVIYWIYVGIRIFIICFYVNSGIIRSFIVVGLVCGAVLYLKALSVYYIKYGVRLVGILLKPLKMLVSVIRIVLQSLRKDRPKNGEI